MPIRYEHLTGTTACKLGPATCTEGRKATCALETLVEMDYTIGPARDIGQLAETGPNGLANRDVSRHQALLPADGLQGRQFSKALGASGWWPAVALLTHDGAVLHRRASVSCGMQVQGVLCRLASARCSAECLVALLFLSVAGRRVRYLCKLTALRKAARGHTQQHVNILLQQFRMARTVVVPISTCHWQQIVPSCGT